MRVAILRERAPFERRVAMVPEVVQRLINQGHEVIIETGAGDLANFGDDEYRERGAIVLADAVGALADADIWCAVAPPPIELTEHVPENTSFVALFQPAAVLDLVKEFRTSRVTAFSLELLPRISRAQAMDALSSQATVSGYRAALIGADRLQKFFPMFMTAAGTVPPAKVLVLGAGVAGLQAIATARRLGANVRANDIRPSSKDEVQSLGATFVELPLETQEGAGGYAREQTEDFLERQRAMIAKEVAMADVVITTAAIPGRTAPRLVSKEMVESMSKGSVIVDLAAESGGNCELSVAGEEVLHQGVVIHGVLNLPSSMATHASFLYARNIAEFVGLLSRDGALTVDFDDEIVSACCVTHHGEVRHEPTRGLLEGESA